MKQKLIELMIDAYNGELDKTKYSEKQAEHVIRNALKDLVSENGQFSYKMFRRNKVALFEIIEEVLQSLVNQGLRDQFSGFAEVRNLAWGEKASFTIPDPNLFSVATISRSNGDLRRQRLDTDVVEVAPAPRGVKIYDDLYRFLTGRVSWTEYVDKVRASIEHSIAMDIYNAIYNSFSDLGASYSLTLSGAFDEKQFDQVLAHVEAASGEPVIYGTRTALRKITPSQVSDAMMDRRNQFGFYGVYNGYEMREIKQAHKPGTDIFAIADDFVLIVPQIGGEKIVKVVNEGEAVIRENTGMNDDFSEEYLFIMHVGIAVVAPMKYGIVKLTY
ncbi:MAG TPA: hypothetical protein VIL29_10495 [Pseudothermotoga sp.]